MMNCFNPFLLGFLMPLHDRDVVGQNFPLEDVTPTPDFTYLQIIFYFLCFVAVLFLASRVSRWLGGKVGGSSGQYLRLVETIYLGPNRTLHLVSVGKQVFLVAAAERSLTLLTEINDVDLITKLQEETVPPTAPGPGAVKSFADYLKKLLEGGAAQREPLADPEVLNSAQRIEERLMKIRTHRGQKTNE